MDNMNRMDEQWRRWLNERCACLRPVLVQEPDRYPHMCAKCGGYVLETRDDDALQEAYERIVALERENRILRIAILVFIVIAIVAVALYDGAVTSAIRGGQP